MSHPPAPTGIKTQVHIETKVYFVFALTRFLLVPPHKVVSVGQKEESGFTEGADLQINTFIDKAAPLVVILSGFIKHY